MGRDDGTVEFGAVVWPCALGLGLWTECITWLEEGGTPRGTPLWNVALRKQWGIAAGQACSESWVFTSPVMMILV